MENILNITSPLNPKSTINRLVDVVSPENLDYIYTEELKQGRSSKYFVSLKAFEKIPCEKTAKVLCDWILDNFERPFMLSVLKESFEEFSNNEANEILDIAKKSNIIFKKIYSNKVIVKNLSNYLKNNQNISIWGFLRFRAREYRRATEKLLANTIDEFYIEKEYQEFIKALKLYINDRTPLIDLLHVKANSNGTFSYFDFKKREISFLVDDDDLIENFFTDEDILISVLIKVAPKRIIWHNNCKNENLNLVNTIKEIFDKRFASCNGCELCANQKEN